MTTREHFAAAMRDRRRYKRGSAEWDYLTRTARKLVWIMRGIPVLEWEQMEREHEQS